jgi:hypothetical protein
MTFLQAPDYGQSATMAMFKHLILLNGNDPAAQ